MDSLLFTAVSGASRDLSRQKIHANNLANSTTQGFRQDLENARSQQVNGPGYASRFLVQSVPGGVDMTPGSLQQTGRDLDVAIKGNGLITVIADNRERYTRNGQIEIGPQGELTINGLPVAGDNGPILLPPFSAIDIAEDGMITVVPQEGGAAIPVDVDRIKLVDIPAAGLRKDATGFLVTTTAIQPRNEEVVLITRHLETSNVSAINEIAASIALNRQFEAQIKMMKVAEELANAGNRLLRS